LTGQFEAGRWIGDTAPAYRWANSLTVSRKSQDDCSGWPFAQAVPGVRIPLLRLGKLGIEFGDPAQVAGSSRLSGEFGGRSVANSTAGNGPRGREHAEDLSVTDPARQLRDGQRMTGRVMAWSLRTVPSRARTSLVSKGITVFGRYTDITYCRKRKGQRMTIKATKRVMALILVTVLIMMSLATIAVAAPASAPPGPAPNAGDGVPDGSGLEAPFGVGLGGAPNAGDGIPDGSGF